MISRYEVWLNNAALSEISPSIYVADIAYPAQSISRETGRFGGRDGMFSGQNDYVEPKKIQISFVVREYLTDDRQQVIQDVIGWAINGGWLKASDRPGQRIYVKLTQPPTVNSVMRWTETLGMEFTAFDFPFWQDIDPVTVDVAKGEMGVLTVGGVHESFVSVTITAEAHLTSVTLSCGGTTIALEGISVNSGQTIVLSYSDEHHLLEIKRGSTPLLNKRTPESDDDLICKPGQNIVSFDADGAATCQFKAWGVWM